MSARVPRLVVIAFVAVLATAGLTYAAQQKLAASTPSTPAAPLEQQRAVLTVPDVRNQAFVFAKGTIQDAGLAWRVTGSVRGYPSNTVVSQTPAAGTRVYDTGAPVVTLTLARNPKYPQQGTPQDVSPYHATATEIADAPSQQLPLPGSATTPATTTPAATTPAATTPGTTTPAAPAATSPAPPAPATTTPAPSAQRAPALHPTTTAAPSAPTHPAAAAPAASRYPQVRPPAFLVSGAPKEPLDEMPLADRARALDRWLSTHRQPTNAAVKHWLYQNEWIVTGARFGWWHGADALRVLIGVDRRTQALWGIGEKSEAVARGALAEVEARSR